MRKSVLFLVVFPLVLTFAQEREKASREKLKKLLDVVLKTREKVKKAVVGEEGLLEFLREAVKEDDSLCRFLLYQESRWGALSLRLVLQNPELPSLVESDDEAERLKALNWLRRRKDADSRKLLVGALSEEDEKVRWKIVKMLGEIGERNAVEPMLRLVKVVKDETSQLILIEALGNIGDGRAIGVLLKLLESPNPNVAAKAAESLGRIGNRGILPVLVEVANESSVEAVRYSAVFALGELEDGRCVDMLLKVLKEESASMRYAAAHSLATIADKRALDALLTALSSDASWGVRWAAAKGIGRICKTKPNRKTLSSLIDALLDDNEAVRKEALSSLRTVTGKDFGDDYKKWKEWFSKDNR